MRAQTLINVMDQFHVRGIVQISQAQQAFALADTFFGQRRSAMLFIQRVIDFLNQLRNNFIDAVVLVGRFLCGTGNDQRRSRLVDQDRVHFVNDRELMATLHAVREIVLHVVAQVIETVLVIGSISNVGTVGRAALRVVEVIYDHADAHAQATI